MGGDCQYSSVSVATAVCGEAAASFDVQKETSSLRGKAVGTLSIVIHHFPPKFVLLQLII